ncbi:MAG: hypothetical protein Ta2A_04730 [Treponemataceae bacterium]|nr:MAG: hypothetical protein Ta2A_04730 [Treponemataceae bacterium]
MKKSDVYQKSYDVDRIVDSVVSAVASGNYRDAPASDSLAVRRAAAKSSAQKKSVLEQTQAPKVILA